MRGLLHMGKLTDIGNFERGLVYLGYRACVCICFPLIVF